MNVRSLTALLNRVACADRWMERQAGRAVLEYTIGSV